jgi:hypothetical protein
VKTLVGSVGPAFMDEIDGVIKSLGSYFKGVHATRLGTTPVSDAGDANAFGHFVHSMQLRLP